MNQQVEKILVLVNTICHNLNMEFKDLI